MKSYRNIYLAATVLLISCEQEPNFKVYDFPAPIVESFAPNSGYIGEDITIVGKDFGDNKAAVRVFFGEIKADSIRSVEDTKIVVKAPSSVTSPIRVVVYGKEDQASENFVFLPSASIKDFSARYGDIGESIEINGENFGTDASEVKVLISGVESEIVSVINSKITFKLPNARNGNLVLRIGRQTVYSSFFTIGSKKLSGTIFGHSGSWSNNAATTIKAAFDGDLNTFVDGATAIGYMGYDFRQENAATVSYIRYAPRSGNPGRMLNGQIRGANSEDLSDFVILHTITQQPPIGVLSEAYINHEKSYRYIYYYTSGGFGNISEIEFYGKVIE